MNTINLKLILSVDAHANNFEYLSSGLIVKHVSKFEQIWRALLSSCFTYFDSSRTACLRASLTTLNEQIQDSSLKTPLKVKNYFNRYSSKMQTLSAPKLEQFVGNLGQWINNMSTGSLLLNVWVPNPVWKTLETLFENSLYPLEKIPLYSEEIVECPEQDKMTFPLMAGFVGEENDRHPFIAIKVERILDQSEQEESVSQIQAASKKIILLIQYRSDGKCYWGGRGEYGWYEIDHSDGPRFFSWNFTYQDTGEGPTETQKDHFLSFQRFLEQGEGTDLNGVKWRIVESSA